MPRHTRRDLLRALGAGATVAGLAGCGQSGPPCGTTADAPRATVAPESSLDGLRADATWAMAGGDAGRTRSTAAAGPVEDVALTWRFDVGDAGPGGGVAVADGRLYAGGDALYALDPVAEAVEWEYRPPGGESTAEPGPVAGSPVVARDAGLVVAGAPDGLHAVDAVSGERRWRYGNGELAPETVAGGTVYASDRDGLHAVDAASGQRRFADETAGRLVGVADGRAVVAEPLRALDAADGAELWSLDVDPSLTAEVRAGTVGDGTVYLVGYDGGDDRLVHAVDAADGTRQWRYRADDLESFQAPAYADGRVVLGSHVTEVGGAHVHVLDAATGDEQWMAALGCEVEAPAVADGVVYVAAGSTLQARRLSDGGLGWYHEHERPCDFDYCEYAAPVVVAGALVARSSAGEVHVFAEE